MASFVELVVAHPFACAAFFLGIPYVAGFVALQKKCFHRAATKALTRFYFYPTAPALALFQKIVKRNRAPDKVDKGVYLGPFPSASLGDVARMHADLKIGGVVNLMDEWEGPVRAYEKYGIQQLYLPTVDHCEPAVSDMERAVDFIQKIRDSPGPNNAVLIHCKGGHGRSAAIACCWLLMSKNLTPQEATEHLLSRRKVRKKLGSQPNINLYWENLHPSEIQPKTGAKSLNKRRWKDTD